MTRLAVVLAIALSLAWTARADCICETDADGDCIGIVTCDPATFNRLAHDTQDAEHARDVTLAANERLVADLMRSLEAQQALVDRPMLWAGAGVALGAAVVIAAVWVAR